MATFDYHFLANHSPDLFGTISELSKRELSNSVASMIPVSETLTLPDFIELNSKPFYKVEVSQLANANNLQIGNNMKVKEQKAAYYNGIQKPIENGIFQPVTIDGYTLSSIEELISRFNSGGTFQLLKPINISSKDDLNLESFKELKQKYGSNLLLMVFTKYQLPNDFLKPMFSLRLRIQTYQGTIDNYKLSNFTVKCLEKLGGILSIIDSTHVPESTYFIGLDLGHSTLKSEKFSNLCMVLFDNRGRQLTYFVVKKIPLNEVVNSEVIWPAFLHFRQHIQKFNLPQSTKLIIHRDGRIHFGEVDELQKQAKKHLWTDNIDVVEVIKSGFPIIAQYDSNNKSYQNPTSGVSWIYDHQKYAILVTNIQANEHENMLSPIVLKHSFGNSNFKELVDQVYWFTKIYTNNLYNSTRLPATTEKANNLVGTSNKRHSSTYMA